MISPEPAPDVAAPELHSVASRLVRGSAVYALANFGIKALSFLLLPVYTRFLTPADYGVISLAETLALIAALLCGLGLDAGIQRLYFQFVENRAELSRYLGSVLRFAVAVDLGVLALSFAFGPALLRGLAPNFQVAFFPYIALAVGAAAATQLLQLRLSLFQSEGRPVAYAALTFVFFALTAGLGIHVVVFRRMSAYGMLLAKLVAAVLLAVAALALLFRWLFAGFEWRYVRETLPLALPLLPHQFMAGGLIAADRFILERYGNLSEVGLYSLAYTFGMVMALVTTSIAQAWSPIYYDVARGGESGRTVIGRMSSDLALALVAVACFGSLIAQDFVRLFLDARYHAIGRLIPWIIGGYLLHAWFTLFQIAVFQGKRVRYMMVVSAIAFVANITSNFALVPRWGMYGAAWATLAAYGLEALLMYVYAQRVYSVPYHRSSMIGSLAVFAGVLALTQLASPASLRPLIIAGAMLASAVALQAFSGGRLLETIRLSLARGKVR